jgi:hypothetical protein
MSIFETVLLDTLKSEEAPSTGLTQVFDTAQLVRLWCIEYNVEFTLESVNGMVKLILDVEKGK